MSDSKPRNIRGKFLPRNLKNKFHVKIFTSIEKAQEFEYPPIPTQPRVQATKYGIGLPSCSGCYFLWRFGQIEYVGKSIRLSERLRVGNHHMLKHHHTISFVLIDGGTLNFAEYYYIGLIRPHLNMRRPPLD